MENNLSSYIFRSINPAFDALVYLGNRADEREMKTCYDQLVKRYPRNREDLDELMIPFFEFEKHMRERVKVDRDILDRYFKRYDPDINAFSSSGNIAGMIFGLAVSRDRFETAGEAAAAVAAMSTEEKLSSLLTYVRKPYVIMENVKDMEDFCRTLCDLKVKKNLKWDCIDCYYNFSKYLEEITPIMETAIDAIREWCEKGSMDFSCLSYDFAENYLRKQMRDFGLPEEKACTVQVYKSIAMPANWEIEMDIDRHEKESIIRRPVGHVGVLIQAMHEFKASAISQECMVDAFKALGDLSRFGILNCLMERPMLGRELAKELGLAPNTISQHLSKLIAEDLVTRKLKGSYPCYSVNSERVSKIADDLKGYFCRTEETD